jgi:hypothetical protein
MLTSARVRLSAIAAATALSFGVAAAPAPAQQTGLINVEVSNNTVQVPIAVAANVCGVQVGILAAALEQGDVVCDAEGTAVARDGGNGGGGGGGPQTGLVNLSITDNTIQVPIGIAANICGIQAGVLAVGLAQGDVTCEALGNSEAEA